MSDIAFTGSELARARRSAGLTQRDLARRAGTSQSAVARIEQGAVSPSIATVARLAAGAGFEMHVKLVPRAPADPMVEAYKRDIDRTLLRENLAKTVHERIRSLLELQEFATALRRAGRALPGQA